MFGLVKNELRNIVVTSVILTRDIDDPEGRKVKMFFCHNCQNPILQYKGDVAWVVPGELPLELPTFIKCSNKNCGRVYSFTSII